MRIVRILTMYGDYKVDVEIPLKHCEIGDLASIETDKGHRYRLSYDPPTLMEAIARTERIKCISIGSIRATIKRITDRRKVSNEKKTNIST